MGAETAGAGFFERRKLLSAEQPDRAGLVAQGRADLEAGLLENALEAFAKAGDAEGQAAVALAAREAGDVFAYEAALKALGRAATTAEWAEIGERALAAGRLWFAHRAFERADNQEGLERARRLMHDAGIPVGEGR